MTVPAVTLPVPPGGPEISTPPISTPSISTPPVKTPPIETPVGTVPSVSVPSVKVGAVTVPPVKTVPESNGGEPSTGGGDTAKPTPSDPPSAGGSSEQAAQHAAPALAVRGTTTHRTESATPAPRRRPVAANATDRHARAPRSSRTRHPTSTVEHVAPSRVERETAPAVGVLDYRAPRAPVPITESAARHETDARPLIDSLGGALDIAPLLMALALGGALCVVSRQMRRVG